MATGRVFGEWQRLQRGCLLVGAGALVACVLGAIFSRQQFFQSYLFAYVFWLGIALGCLGIVMLHNLSGGAWGIAIRHLLESGMRTLPLLALLFLPLLFGLHYLYEWAHPEAVAGDPLLQHKAAYLNLPFFVLRAALYFIFWVGAALLLSRPPPRAQGAANALSAARQRALSGPGLAVYVLTITFASIDWIMSLQAHWYSTIFGIHFLGGHALAAFAFAILFLGITSRRVKAADKAAPAERIDLGNLLLGFVMLWAYFAFSQWLIIWSGNLPEEVIWYTSRNSGGWEWLARLLAVCHFFVPFLLLLSRRNKRSRDILAAIAATVLVMRLLDIFWYTVPAFHPGQFTIHWMDVAAPLGLGGIWLAGFFWQLSRLESQPLGAAALQEVTHHG